MKTSLGDSMKSNAGASLQSTRYGVTRARVNMRTNPEWRNTKKYRRLLAEEVAASGVFREFAYELRSRVRKNLAILRDTGDFQSRLAQRRIVSKGGKPVDFEFYVSAPGIAALEFGHLSGKRGAPYRHWVSGRKPFRNAVLGRGPDVVQRVTWVRRRKK